MKKVNILFYFLPSLIMILYSCSKEKESPNNKDYQYCTSNNANHHGNNFEQYTPKQAQWCTFQTKVFDAGNTSHAPNGFAEMTKADWDKCKWDGKPFNPEKLSKKQLHEALFPVKNMMRGLRELYYKHKPFKDEKNPSKAEVDEWHRLLITHFRALTGYTEEKYHVKNSYTAYMRVLWSDEIKFTTSWNHLPDASKFQTGKAHAGWLFFPPKEEQKEYYPREDFTLCCPAGAEGVSSTKSNYPWSVKLSFTLSNYIKNEGFWGGHVGPFMRREKLGLSFWDLDKDDVNSFASVRDLGVGRLEAYKHDRAKNPFPDKEK